MSEQDPNSVQTKCEAWDFVMTNLEFLDEANHHYNRKELAEWLQVSIEAAIRHQSLSPAAIDHASRFAELLSGSEPDPDSSENVVQFPRHDPR